MSFCLKRDVSGRGRLPFLELRRIDWTTSAMILERLIAYEAVHEIRGWEDLRQRLGPERRCFAYFHPAFPDEPLIFVEVALCHGLAAEVAPLLSMTAKQNGRPEGVPEGFGWATKKAPGDWQFTVRELTVKENDQVFEASKQADGTTDDRANLRMALVAALVKPSISIDDYEHSREITDPTWMIMPEVVPAQSVKAGKHGVFRYPGIKEDVYVPSFRPDLHLRESLGLDASDLVVTMRPPATEGFTVGKVQRRLR